MKVALDARLVLRWTCQACGYVNYFTESGSGRFPEERAEAAEELGCSPDDLSLVPDVLHCGKCEEPHKLPDGFGIAEEN